MGAAKAHFRVEAFSSAKWMGLPDPAGYHTGYRACRRPALDRSLCRRHAPFAAVSARAGVAALAHRIVPVGAVDVGEQFALPPLPSSEVVLHSTLTDLARSRGAAWLVVGGGFANTAGRYPKRGFETRRVTRWLSQRLVEPVEHACEARAGSGRPGDGRPRPRPW